MSDPEPKIHKKVVDIQLSDLRVHLECEDTYQINAVGQYALDIMSELVKTRSAYENIDSSEGGGDVPPEQKTIAESQKPEILKMYQ